MEMVAMSTAEPVSDSIIDEGFPDGWYVQDRPKENTALLIAPALYTGAQTVCLRPRLVNTKDWLPIARQIAAALSHVQAPAEVLIAALKQIEDYADDVGAALVAWTKRANIALKALEQSQETNSKILACGGVNPTDWWDDLIAAQQNIAAVIREARHD